MLFQDNGRSNRSFQTVGLIMFYHFPKRPERSALALPVVWHLGEVSLDQCGRAQRLNQSPLLFCERFRAWLSFHKARAISRSLKENKLEHEIEFPGVSEHWTAETCCSVIGVNAAGRRLVGSNQSAGKAAHSRGEDLHRARVFVVVLASNHFTDVRLYLNNQGRGPRNLR